MHLQLQMGRSDICAGVVLSATPVAPTLRPVENERDENFSGCAAGDHRLTPHALPNKKYE